MKATRKRQVYVLLIILSVVLFCCTLSWFLVMLPGGSAATGCGAKCWAEASYQYPEEVDLRIIVLAFNRHTSLMKCLHHVQALDMMGDTVRVEIWIDRAKGVPGVSTETLQVAREFMANHSGVFSGSPLQVRVHERERPAGILVQWVYTWRPPAGSHEIGLILEDDVDVSPYAYRWLKAVKRRYGNRQDVAGYSLQSENRRFFAKRNPHTMEAPPAERVFLYGVLGTWGFAPHADRWRQFQDWIGKARAEGVKPYVPGIIPTDWYRMFERHDTQDNMWEMWQIFFSHIHQLYCVYNNLAKYSGQQNVLLSTNRQERGLHFKGRSGVSRETMLLTHWNESYVEFPEDIIKYSYDGSVIKKRCFLNSTMNDRNR